MDWAASDLAERDLYKLLVNTVLPRPIALVTTVDAQGRANAAPFSFFNVFSHAPPLVVLGIEGRDNAPSPLKDTMRNIRETGSFVVNLVDRAMVEAMQICAIDFPGEVDEIEAAGLTTAPSAAIAAPRLIASPVQLECRETVSLALGTRHRNLVVGEIVHLHIRDGIVDERLHVDIDRLDLVGRLHGADWYVTLRDRFQVLRQTLAGWRERTRTIPEGEVS
ncbi:flavin reductase family protein [Bosea sp. F3-2]|uniref:flavin reductase family protein n=1 Tax=Bosea sp. F3-2 TaxID=2599640 RepID=UPI0011EE821F|nr:flavin reductase family protein [Bosea sp. F3-2]QEL24840.1 flavin reductase family protein [Bosea sp. F3-2]